MEDLETGPGIGGFLSAHAFEPEGVCHGYGWTDRTDGTGRSAHLVGL